MIEHPEDNEYVEPEATETPEAEDTQMPMATGTQTAYTTGTLESGEVGPAVVKPESEGPTRGEGPIEETVQADDPGE